MSAPIYRPSTQTVLAKCSSCEGAQSAFQSAGCQHILNESHRLGDVEYVSIHYVLLRCPGCNRGAFAVLHTTRGQIADMTPKGVYLESFYPFSADALPLPAATPADLKTEFREAELCAAAGAFRGACALFRSTLEKALKANGYTKAIDKTLTDLKARINAAAADGVITDARKTRAHDEIRVLGNDVLHDEWRLVTPEEVETAHRYTHRILEDLYDDRATVERVLIAKKRLPATPTAGAAAPPSQP
jgi:hypothetical protein